MICNKCKKNQKKILFWIIVKIRWEWFATSLQHPAFSQADKITAIVHGCPNLNEQPSNLETLLFSNCDEYFMSRMFYLAPNNPTLPLWPQGRSITRYPASNTVRLISIRQICPFSTQVSPGWEFQEFSSIWAKYILSLWPQKQLDLSLLGNYVPIALKSVQVSITGVLFNLAPNNLQLYHCDPKVDQLQGVQPQKQLDSSLLGNYVPIPLKTVPGGQICPYFP